EDECDGELREAHGPGVMGVCGRRGQSAPIADPCIDGEGVAAATDGQYAEEDDHKTVGMFESPEMMGQRQQVDSDDECECEADAGEEPYRAEQESDAP